ncbi:TPA: protein YecU [Escherichia coli]
MIKIFIGHYINAFNGTVVDALKKQPLLFLAKLMVYSAALTFFTANFHCNMTRKINEYA